MVTAADKTTVSLVDVGTYLPENRVPAAYYEHCAGTDDLRNSPMFRAPPFRHHSAIDESNVDMIERATMALVERHGVGMLAGVDVLLTHSQLPDLPILGAGGEISYRLGMSPEYVVDVHNGGCAAFVLMIKLARQLLVSGAGRSALIAVAQNCAGKVFEQEHVRQLAQSAVPGDGAAVGLLTLSDDSPVLDVECRHYGQYAGDMAVTTEPPRLWWQAGSGELCVNFDDAKITKVLARGNRQVPEVALAVCDRIGVKSEDLDLLVTNQPNRIFLRNWSEALQLPHERHVDTFNEYGNLFAVGIPVNFDAAISDGHVKPGDIVMMAGFAHAGDFAAAAAIRWGGRAE
ncbi:3-oxoacyl-ACP synthase III family protein [Candidatus Mycobacterium methanotrophicum]|uniref:3-oxoacyl-ACP synthase n=1 Tax=Candidatus Mycobacterium methanotrophicum TaxID=2943498 RepID=A0ABY4QJ38_9MYCO|nr:3-oxoacyl-[acyl-carrier-protein] synthase III C-terminal domain-containing protein [Candidatus Mycobacterium methanotrophicum]UQX10586.1 3-oxoacyl-ACP synthase [Candidatus Mycobacterium methanotrophicum]